MPRKGDKSEAKEMWAVIHETRQKANDTAHDLRSHEAMCSERYNSILKQLGAQSEILKFQNRLMITTAIGMISGLFGVIWTMFVQR